MAEGYIGTTVAQRPTAGPQRLIDAAIASLLDPIAKRVWSNAMLKSHSIVSR
jgi:hypothetical protein